MRKILILWALVGAAALADPQFRGGAVATEHPLASAAGLAMLDQKGNAVDAAVAAAFTLAVVTPYHSGIGGGGFALRWDAGDKKASVLDFREVAPSGATHDMYLEDGVLVRRLPVDGPFAVAVPGAVAGYLELIEKHGKLKRAQVLAPAIKAAKEGFIVTPKFQKMCDERDDLLALDKDAARVFMRPDAQGKARCPSLGTVIKQPELAATLEQISRDGAKAFYSGRVAKAIAEKAPLVTEADLAAFKTREREPLSGSYRGHRVLSMPPPSAGGIAVLQTLGVLERATPQGIAERSVSAVHTYIEALRRVYQARGSSLGDPAFVELPVEKMLSAASLDEMARSIDVKHASSSSLPDGGTPKRRPHKHTSHISVIDRDGNATALTTTVNYYFGSCVWAAGFFLNDQMDDFAAQPGVANGYGLVAGEANSIAPGKIPLSSMSPTLVFQKDRPNEVMLAVGAAGGPIIPTAVIQIISNVIDGKMMLSRAVGRPRIHHQWLPDEVDIEPGALDPSTRAALEQLGHRFEDDGHLGEAAAVLVDPQTGWTTASSDPRNEGAPAGQP